MSKKQDVLRKFKQRDIQQERQQMHKLLPVNVEIDKEDLDALVWLPVDTQTKLQWINEIIREKSAIK
jgi:hypothetical protein